MNFLKLSTFALSLLAGHAALADNWQYVNRGYLFGRLQSYTHIPSRNFGQQSRVQFEQLTTMGPNVQALNQVRFTSNSINADLTENDAVTKKETFETYAGENFLKYKSESWVAQIGYQEVVWGEAFGFNYADIISPKDERETLYADAADARLPLLLFNGKAFFNFSAMSGSVQFLYSPEPRFNKSLPIEVYAGKLLPAIPVTIEKSKTPKLFSESDIGGKLSLSAGGFDVSFFQFNYLDRAPYYKVRSFSLSSIDAVESHDKISSTGFSLAKTLADVVFRTDVVLTKDKTFNYINSTLMLDSYKTDSTNILLSLDTPTYNNYAGVFIFARSTLKEVPDNSFRKKNEQYAIGKITKSFGDDRSLEFSYTHEFENTGHSIQSFISWPINSQTDLKIGGQFYSGAEESNMNKFKNVSSLFFSIKNYFQL